MESLTATILINRCPKPCPWTPPPPSVKIFVLTVEEDIILNTTKYAVTRAILTLSLFRITLLQREKIAFLGTQFVESYLGDK